MTSMKDEVSDIKTKQAAMQTDIIWIKKEQENQSYKIDNQIKKIDSLNESINAFIKTADDKYADKKKVDMLDNEVKNINLTLAKWAGIIFTSVVIIELILKYFILK